MSWKQSSAKTGGDVFGIELAIAILVGVGIRVGLRGRRHRLALARVSVAFPERPALETDGDRKIDAAMRPFLQDGEEIEQQAVVQDASLHNTHYAALTNLRVMVLLSTETKARSVKRDQIANVMVFEQRMVFFAKGASADLIVLADWPGVSATNQEAFLVAVARLFGRRELPRAIAQFQ